MYFAENLDRALTVLFGTLTAALFFLLLVILYFVTCPRKKYSHQAERIQGEERTNFVSTQIHDALSTPSIGRDTTNGHNRNSCEDNTGISLQQQKCKKRRTAVHSQMLLKFCSCCCGNVLCHRNEEAITEDPATQPTSPTDEDIIDIINDSCVEETTQFQGPLPYSARRDSAISPPEEVNKQLFQNEDTTSEYEFVDVATPTVSRPQRPTTLETNFQNFPMTSGTDFRNLSNKSLSGNNKPFTTEHPHAEQSRFYSSRQRTREPPPFPRQSGFNLRHQTVSTLPLQWGLYQPHQFSTNTPRSASPTPVQRVPPRSNYQNPYVSLQPTFNEARRDSFYDNSLPRDSLLYEFYHGQMQHRPELPGTRNINQYFS